MQRWPRTLLRSTSAKYKIHTAAPVFSHVYRFPRDSNQGRKAFSTSAPKMGIGGILVSQWASLPYPTKKFSGQTIVVTGSNIGLGLEAARHFVRLDAARVILAVRTLSKGEAAAASIEESTSRKGVCEVWELDMARYDSVKQFAQRLNTLDRLDALVANAGIRTFKFTRMEGNESQVTVNVISTMLLGIMAMPKLRESAVKNRKPGVLSFTGSFVHWLTKFPERHADNMFQELADESKVNVADRYNVTKMMELLAVRQLAEEVTKSQKNGQVVINVLNPGWVKTNIGNGEPENIAVRAGRKVIARDTEVGSRTLVHAAEGGEETHGQYLSDCKVGE